MKRFTWALHFTLGVIAGAAFFAARVETLELDRDRSRAEATAWRTELDETLSRQERVADDATAVAEEVTSLEQRRIQKALLTAPSAPRGTRAGGDYVAPGVSDLHITIGNQ